MPGGTFCLQDIYLYMNRKCGFLEISALSGTARIWSYVTYVIHYIILQKVVIFQKDLNYKKIEIITFESCYV